jgi:sialate O-acetylesterase
VYGKELPEYSSPLYDSMKIDENKIRISFKRVGSGLEAKGERLTGFSIAGEDRTFVWADAKLDGNTVVVSSDKVAKPVAVRYAWADYPECNLYNKEGLPASPFRTDNWPRK